MAILTKGTERFTFYLLGEVVPSLYVPQMMWQMACCERDWNMFVSYCPDFPEPLDLFVAKLTRDEEAILAMEDDAVQFIREVEILTERISGGKRERFGDGDEFIFQTGSPESRHRRAGKGRVPSTPAIRMASFVMLGREKQTMVCPDCEGYGRKLAGSEAA